jgi:hypothetical protein
MHHQRPLNRTFKWSYHAAMPTMQPSLLVIRMQIPALPPLLSVQFIASNYASSTMDVNPSSQVEGLSLSANRLNGNAFDVSNAKASRGNAQTICGATMPPLMFTDCHLAFSLGCCGVGRHRLLSYVSAPSTWKRLVKTIRSLQTLSVKEPKAACCFSLLL